MGDPTSIDIPLLKVPFESLKRVSRDRKYNIDDLRGLVNEINDLAEQSCSDEERKQGIDKLIARSQELQQQLQDRDRQEKADAERCRQRLQCLNDAGMPAKDHILDWNRQRLPRILADHLLRSGHAETASLLTKTAHLEGLTDDYIFQEAQPILHSLKQRDCSPALHWCDANRSRLKKHKSKLEFKLRTQEFIELVRAGQKMQAITHSQQHLQSWASAHPTEFHQVMGSLVFGQAMEDNPYADLFDQGQWDKLVRLFYQELFKLHGMTHESLLSIELQAGLSALKPPSLSAASSKDDPLQNEDFQRLAEGLPYAKHVHSRLICKITKELMNEDNPPIMLPSGDVYSEKGIQQNSYQNFFMDPWTKETMTTSALRRAYIS